MVSGLPKKGASTVTLRLDKGAVRLSPQGRAQGCAAARKLKLVYKIVAVETDGDKLHVEGVRPALSARRADSQLEPAADGLDDHLLGLLEVVRRRGDRLEDPGREQLLDRAVEAERRELRRDVGRGRCPSSCALREDRARCPRRPALISSRCARPNVFAARVTSTMITFIRSGSCW